MPEGLQKGDIMPVGILQDRYKNINYLYSAQPVAQTGIKTEDFYAVVSSADENLQDNLLTPASQKKEIPKEYIENEIEYYKSFISKPDNLSEQDKAAAENNTDFQSFLQDKIRELFLKIQNGETEPSFQIGAQSFTIKEWDEFLEKFDSAEEAIQELMKEENEKNTASQIKQEDKVKDITESDISPLVSESTACSYPKANPEDEGTLYITWYTPEGIFCRKEGQTEGYEWSIAFDSKEQYDKVMEFIRKFPSDWNMRFAAHENFWKDFLNDEIDMEGFTKFLDGTNKGVPDYSKTDGDSVYIDKEKMQWAKYLNPLEGQFYTAEEFHKKQMDIVAENASKLHKLTDPYEPMYKKTHPEYNGEKIFCEYPGGPLYTANEMAKLMYDRYMETSGRFSFDKDK